MEPSPDPLAEGASLQEQPAAIREDQVTSAVSFLSHPKVSEGDSGVDKFGFGG